MAYIAFAYVMLTLCGILPFDWLIFSMLAFIYIFLSD